MKATSKFMKDIQAVAEELGISTHDVENRMRTLGISLRKRSLSPEQVGQLASYGDLEKHISELLEEHPDLFWTCIGDLNDCCHLVIDMSDRQAILKALIELAQALFLTE